MVTLSDVEYNLARGSHPTNKLGGIVVQDLDIRDFLDGDRLNHSLGVMDLVEKVVVNNDTLIPVYKDWLVKAAEIHDIGYSDKIEKLTGFHPLDGYLFLKDKVPLEISLTILMHTESQELVKSESDEVQKLFNTELRKAIKHFKHINSFIDTFVNLVSLGDMLINSKGARVSLEQRYQNVVDRYGEADIRSKVMLKSLPKYERILDNHFPNGFNLDG